MTETAFLQAWREAMTGDADAEPLGVMYAEYQTLLSALDAAASERDALKAALAAYADDYSWDNTGRRWMGPEAGPMVGKRALLEATP